MHARLQDVDVPWCVVGGWSIDLALGRVTREHEDLEIAIVRADFPIARDALAPHAAHAVGDGEVRRLGTGEVPSVDKHQSWFLDERAQAWRVDVMLEAGDVDTWVCRRDEAIREPRTAMIGRTPDGIPYLRPHATLLFKAKYVRPKDEADFQVCLPTLAASERSWLRAAIERVHPGHPWLGVV